MEIVTNILGAIARAIKRASPGTFETSLTIPDQFFPQIKLIEPSQFPANATTDTKNTSVITYSQGQVANAGAASATVIVLAPGFWELNFHTVYSSNYPTAPNNGLQIQIQQGNNAATFGTTELLMEMFCTTAGGGSLIQERSFEFATEFGVDLTWMLSGNGAGNSHGFSMSLIANKLV